MTKAATATEIPPIIPRPAVERFAALMEEVLRQNDHKGGWEREGKAWLLWRALDEFAELLRVATNTSHGYLVAGMVSMAARELMDGDVKFNAANGVEAVRGEIADVANFLMMLHDRLPKETR